MTSTPVRPPTAPPARPQPRGRRPLPTLPADPHPHVHAERVGDVGWAFRRAEPPAVTRTPRPGKPGHLTLRMVDVLQELADHGGTNGEIGKRLHLSMDTVKTHLRRASAILGARDRAHAVILAMRGGWIA